MNTKVFRNLVTGRVKNMDRTMLVLLTILLFALFLRLPYADGRSSYAYQELLRDLGVVQTMDQGGLVLSGPPSCHGDFHFGPIYYYILYPAAKLSSFAPYSLAVSSMIASLLTIFLVFRLTRRWWKDDRISLLAAGLLGISFLDIQFAKYASNPNFVPIFTVALIYSLTALSDRRSSPWWALLAGSSLGAGMQLHAVPLLALPLLTAIVIIGRKVVVDLPRVALFALGLCAALLPYAVYEISTGFSNVATLFAIGSAESFGRYADILSDNMTFWVSTVLSSHQFFNTALDMGFWLMPAAVTVILPAFIIFRSESGRSVSSISRPASGSTTPRFLIIAWLISFSAILLLPMTSLSYLRIYYFIGLLPLTYILIAVALVRLASNSLPRTAIYLFVVYGAIQLSQFLYYRSVVSALNVGV